MPSKRCCTSWSMSSMTSIITMSMSTIMSMTDMNIITTMMTSAAADTTIITMSTTTMSMTTITITKTSAAVVTIMSMTNTIITKNIITIITIITITKMSADAAADDHHHADEIFTSWGIETVHKFSRAELEDTLSLMGVTKNFGTVLRAKGIVESDDGTWMEFDMVPEELEIRECQPDYIGRVCVIGTELDEEALKRVFVIS